MSTDHYYHIHRKKYRQTGEDFYSKVVRIADALKDTPDHFEAFKDTLRCMRFLPAGRVQNAMGSVRQTTAFNCFVSGHIEDSMDSIMLRHPKRLRQCGGVAASGMTSVAFGLAEI